MLQQTLPVVCFSVERSGEEACHAGDERPQSAAKAGEREGSEAEAAGGGAFCIFTHALHLISVVASVRDVQICGVVMFSLHVFLVTFMPLLQIKCQKGRVFFFSVRKVASWRKRLSRCYHVKKSIVRIGKAARSQRPDDDVTAVITSTARETAAADGCPEDPHLPSDPGAAGRSGPDGPAEDRED